MNITIDPFTHRRKCGALLKCSIKKLFEGMFWVKLGRCRLLCLRRHLYNRRVGLRDTCTNLVDHPQHWCRKKVAAPKWLPVPSSQNEPNELMGKPGKPHGKFHTSTFAPIFWEHFHMITPWSTSFPRTYPPVGRLSILICLSLCRGSLLCPATKKIR